MKHYSNTDHLKKENEEEKKLGKRKTDNSFLQKF